MKIDVEGAELDVMEGYKNIFNINFIQYEFNTCWYNANRRHSEIMNKLHQYKHYLISKDGLRLIKSPFEKYFYCNILASKFDLGDNVEFLV